MQDLSFINLRCLGLIPGYPALVHDGTQGDVVHDFSQDQDQADRPVVPWIFFPVLLVGGHYIS